MSAELLENLRVELKAEVKTRWNLAKETGDPCQKTTAFVLESMANALARTLRSTSNTSVSGPCPPSPGSENKNQLSGG